MKPAALIFLLLAYVGVVYANDGASFAPSHRTLAPLVEEEALSLCVTWHAGRKGNAAAKLEFMRLYSQRYLAQSGRELFLQTFNLNNWISYYHATQAMAANNSARDIGDEEIIVPAEVLAQAADQQALSVRWGGILKPWQSRRFDRLSARTKVLIQFLGSNEGKESINQKCFFGESGLYNQFVEDILRKDVNLGYLMITAAILGSALAAAEAVALKSAGAVAGGAENTLALLGQSIRNRIALTAGPAAPAIAAYWDRLRSLGQKIQNSDYFPRFFQYLGKFKFVTRTLKWLGSAMASGFAFDSIYNLAAGDQRSAIEIIKNKISLSKVLTPGELTLIRQFCTDVIQASKSGVRNPVTNMDSASSPSCLLPSTQETIAHQVAIHRDVQQGLERIIGTFGPDMRPLTLNLCTYGFAPPVL